MAGKSDTAAYEKIKEEALKRRLLASATARDVGPIPKAKNARRRNAARLDFEKFCLTYLPGTFPIPFCADHRKVIAKIMTAVLQGGLFAMAMPRGSGKTSLAEAACVWALLYAHRSFVVLIGSEEGLAEQMLLSIKVELETNEDLYTDFPEVCHPIVSLQRIAHRCKGQTLGGEPTYLGWGAGELVLPTVPGSKASGGVAVATGLTASIRGMKHKRPDGVSVRPDLVVIDDPQTDESSRSASQCAYRERVLKGAVLGLAGPRKKISGILPCTVIAPGDLADRILDPMENPEWNGERTKLLYAFPADMKLWEQYAQLRADGLRAGDNGKTATEFYRANRAAMDRGAVVAWVERFNPDEVSAIQHAMNLWLADPDSFASEYQNEPVVPREETDATRIDAVAASRRLNGVPRGILPTRAATLTGYIDVQHDLLYWAVCAWESGFTGHLVDYGAFPDQQRPYYRKSDPRPSLATHVGVSSTEGSIWRGLELLVEQLISRDWRRDDGSTMHLSRLLVDSGWQTDLIYRFCLQGVGKKWAAVLTASKGKGITEGKAPMNEWAPRPNEKKGPGWIHRAAAPGKPPLMLIDTNMWKTFVASRLNQSPGEQGAFFLCGDRPDDHRLFCDHLASERGVRKGDVEVWVLPPDKPDNEFLDCLVGCAVGAAHEGIELAVLAVPPVQGQTPISYREAQRRRQQERSRNQGPFR